MLDDKNIMKRANLLGVLLFVFAIAIIVKVFVIQTVEKNDLISDAESRAAQLKEIEPPKGNIYSSDNRLLVTTVPEYEVRLDMMVVKNHAGEFIADSLKKLSKNLSALFQDAEPQEYLEKINNAYEDGNRYFLVHRRVSYLELEKLKEFPVLNKGRFKGGFIFIKKNRRKRPHGWLAHRTLGYVRDNGQAVGLEREYDSLISGEVGLQFQKKVSGDWIPVSNEYEREPVDGADLYTTIDVNIQDVAENALYERLMEHNAKRGCVVVMEVETGKIKAIANLNQTKSGGYFESYNFAVGRSTEPGSTFKLPVLMAAMEDSKFDLEDSVDTENGTVKYYNHTIRDSKLGGYGVVSVEQAFAYSSNVAMAKLIWDNYQDNQEDFILGIKKLGLAKKSGVQIAGEPAPYIKNTKDKAWSGISLPQMAYGYEVLQTPIQILTFYNAVANDGKMMRPMLVSKVEREGQLIEEYKPEVLMEHVASENTIRQAQKMMEAVVEYGTAKKINNPYFKIAGKTGTAQMLNEKGNYGEEGNRKYQASFAGYFPAENPKYSIIVVVSAPSSNGFYASEVAAPIFKEIAYKLYANYFKIQERTSAEKNIVDNNMPYSKNGNRKALEEVMGSLDVPFKTNEQAVTWVRTTSGPKEIVMYNNSIKDGFTPDVKGMSVMDAVFLLENEGFKVELDGQVGYVRSQSIPKGTRVKKGRTIKLTVS